MMFGPCAGVVKQLSIGHSVSRFGGSEKAVKNCLDGFNGDLIPTERIRQYPVGAVTLVF